MRQPTVNGGIWQTAVLPKFTSGCRIDPISRDCAPKQENAAAAKNSVNCCSFSKDNSLQGTFL